MLLPDHGRGYLSKIYDDGWMTDHGFTVDTETETTTGSLA